ncbi:helix-turn-helix domain-containing protein [Flavilitoribacter nigricans]|uniref:HTH araC/xylS-type domain-containing protein n=1 Tax=Flavilitoribacter nigricans (strain ATCC 23147 / DSM 23189 / NBRC 102662 / NCIMB 1420 / SS-2) TaxID=1122177 RepID=A0A2D0NDR4_FLAN2|nr:AraC family transcriptional regulator [Flavilitoribacter nigricans]PHN06617.1 hypothetical protein CRP01_09970 [Flavilitoribacter nigricans DSM 23189 = NBRC 102662]
MELWKSTLFLLGGIGVINGLLLSGFLLFSRERKTKNTILGLLILMICLRIGKSMYYYIIDDASKLVLQIGLTACVFIGPLFHLYTKAISSNDPTIRSRDLILPALIGTGIITVGIIYPYEQFPDFWRGTVVGTIYSVWTVFTVLGLVKMRGIFRKSFNNFRQLEKEEKKSLFIAIGIVFITITYQLAFWVSGPTYLWGSLIFTSLLYSYLYTEIRRLIRQPNRRRSGQQPALEAGPELFEQVERAMQEHQLYKKPALKLKELANVTGIHTHLLSQVLNETYAHGFAAYVNEKRIEEAKKLMLSDSQFTLEGIGYEAGFNSKSSFYATFKKMTGSTPAEYKNQQSVGRLPS